MDRNIWISMDFQNSFNFTVIGAFGHQMNDSELILFGGFKYLETHDTILTETKKKSTEFVLYPFNNPHVFIFNVDKNLLTCNDYYHLPYGILNTGNQLIYSQKKIYFVGNLNSNSFYTNISYPEFTEEMNS